MTKYQTVILLISFAAFVQEANALGKLWGHLKPKSYQKGDQVPIFASELFSRVPGRKPFDFYALEWCDIRDTRPQGMLFDLKSD